MKTVKISIRECPFCKELRNTYYGSEVGVVPYYKSSICSKKDFLTLTDHPELNIKETFICPNCGNKVVKDYLIDLTQEDMQNIIDNYLKNKE